MTYGSTLDGEPNLISVWVTNGTLGFVLRSDLVGYQPTRPEDALQWQESRPASVTVPVWDAEDEEVLGEFVIGGLSGAAPTPTTRRHRRARPTRQ